MREFLKSLDLGEGVVLSKENIDKIMAEHGKYLTTEKEKIGDLQEKIKGYETESANYKKQIDDLNSTIEDKDKTLENLQGVTNENKDLKAQLQMKDSGVKKEFSKFVTSEVMASVNDDTDFETALKNYKNDNPQYFGETVVKKVQSSPSLNTGVKQPQTTNDIMNNILRSAGHNE